MTFEEVCEEMTFCSSYERMGVLTELLRTQQINLKTFYRLLGDYWSECDNISAYMKILGHLLPKEGPVVEMMSKDELTKYKSLPNVITIYRGCGHKNKKGASWSLDKNIASRFPFLTRYKVDDPTLITATVKKSQVLAIKLERDEQEIITFNAKQIKSEELTMPEEFIE